MPVLLAWNAFRETAVTQSALIGDRLTGMFSRFLAGQSDGRVKRIAIGVRCCLPLQPFKPASRIAFMLLDTVRPGGLNGGPGAAGVLSCQKSFVS